MPPPSRPMPPADGAPSGPREVVTALYRPGHRLFQIAFRADITEVPLSKLWSVLKKRGVAIVSATLTNIDGSGGRWNVFLDTADYAITPEGMGHILEGLDLRDLKIAGGSELIVDDLYFPIITTTGSRAMLIGQDVLQRMLGAMGEQFGTGGSLISYQEGVAMGALSAGEMQATVKGDLRRFIGEAVKMYSANGIGRARFVGADFDSFRFVLEMRHNIECEGKKSKKPNSEWIRGHLSGSASAALGIPMTCSETKCMAMGDPYCEFEIKKLEG